MILLYYYELKDLATSLIMLYIFPDRCCIFLCLRTANGFRDKVLKSLSYTGTYINDGRLSSRKQNIVEGRARIRSAEVFHLFEHRLGYNTARKLQLSGPDGWKGDRFKLVLVRPVQGVCNKRLKNLNR